MISMSVPSEKELFPFQTTGVSEILRRKNVLLADEMGLGKTIEILCAINTIKPKRVLVVCPKSLTYNWRNEARDWLLTHTLDEDFCIGTPSFCDPSQDFLIASYEVVAQYAAVLKSQPWDWIILDEAHYIKNPSTKRFRGTKELITHFPDAKIIFATGTPIVNYPIELFPLLNLLDPARWSSSAAFERRYTYGGARRAYGRNLPELQSVLRESVMIRRLKKEVLPELPTKRRQVIEFPSDGFDELLAEEMKIFEGSKRKSSSVDMLTERILEMNAAGAVEGETDWSSIIDELKYDKHYFFEEMARVRHLVAQAKLPFIFSHIDDVLESHKNGEKLVVFAHHKDILHEIAHHIQEFLNDNNSVEILEGATQLEARQGAVDKFQKQEFPKVLVCGLKVAGHGYNMTRADHVIFAELDWVPGVITQAEDRLHRIGQENKILVQHLTIQNSLDSYMAKKIVAKQKQINKTINRL